MKKAHVVAIAILLSLGLLPGVGDAQLSVFDPINYVENTMTALHSVMMEANQLTQIYNQVMMLDNMLKQVEGLNTSNPFQLMAEVNQLNNDAASIGNMISVDQNLYGALNQQGTFLTNINSWTSYTGKTPTQWVQSQALLSSAGNQQAQNNMQMAGEIQQHIQTLATQRQNLQTSLTLSPTQLQAQQLTGQQIDIVAGEQADMVQLLAAQTKTQATAQAQQIAIQQQAASATQAYVTDGQSEQSGINAIIAQPSFTAP